MGAVRFERRGHVAWITLDRPDAMHLLNAEMFVALRDAWAEVRDDDAIRCVVLTATGTKDFCCGGDLGEMIPLWTGAKEPTTDLERAIAADPELVYKVFFRTEPMVKPIVSAINGRALGGGTEMVLATDVRIASSTAIFGLPEPKQGIVPGAGSMVRLARQVGYADAMKLLLTGDPIDAAEALRIGLVSEVVEPDALLERADALATTIAANAPLALQAIKRTVLESHTEAWADAFTIETNESIPVMLSQDAREGPRAFKEKRTPDFEGR